MLVIPIIICPYGSPSFEDFILNANRVTESKTSARSIL
jgi:hypothetical protein